jgi:hypothetical protein
MVTTRRQAATLACPDGLMVRRGGGMVTTRRQAATLACPDGLMVRRGRGMVTTRHQAATLACPDGYSEIVPVRQTSPRVCMNQSSSDIGEIWQNTLNL